MYHEWKERATHLAHFALHTETGKQVVTGVAGTALVATKVALATVVAAPLLPILAAGGAVWGLYRLWKNS